MKLFEEKRSPAGRRAAASFLLVAILAALFWAGAEHLRRTVWQQQTEQVRDMVQKALVTCYAIEGAYPPSIAYLEQRYGVRIDHSRFDVQIWQSEGSSRPTIEVTRK